MITSRARNTVSARLAISSALVAASLAFLHCSAPSAPGPCAGDTCTAGETNGPTSDDGGLVLNKPGASGGSGSSNGGGGSSNGGASNNGGSGNGNGGSSSSSGGEAGTGTGSTGTGSAPPPVSGSIPRLVAYVNVTCGFGVGTNGGECQATPDPTVNYVQQAEASGSSPITHYVLSFLSFQGQSLQTDPGEIWKTGASTSDFTLVDGVREALVAAKAQGKTVMLSIGGAAGSTGFLSWWSALGGSGGVAAMGQEIQRVASAFKAANGFAVDGFDVDIELGGVYSFGSNDYDSTRDLINAVPESYLVAFVPQIGNGLCAAPNVGDPLPPSTTLGGQCPQPVNGDDSPWVLARLDTDCKRSDGSPKLAYWGIQYYNAGQADCCGGGVDTPTMIESTVQSYVDLANGWPASGDLSQSTNPWHAYQYFPGAWGAFAGIGADRLVLGKPGCQGCAGSDYLGLADMATLVAGLDGKLAGKAGGMLFWDLGRLFAGSTSNCVSGACQPSWGGSASVMQNLATLRSQMAQLKGK